MLVYAKVDESNVGRIRHRARRSRSKFDALS